MMIDLDRLVIIMDRCSALWVSWLCGFDICCEALCVPYYLLAFMAISIVLFSFISFYQLY